MDLAEILKDEASRPNSHIGYYWSPPLPEFIDMTLFAEEGKVGDCWRCCIATLVYLTAADVPHFVELYEDTWLSETNKWLRERIGKELFNGPAEFPVVPGDPAWLPVILIGRSPRGLGHAILVDWNSGQMIHDPHPSRDGLVSENQTFVLRDAAAR